MVAARVVCVARRLLPSLVLATAAALAVPPPAVAGFQCPLLLDKIPAPPDPDVEHPLNIGDRVVMISRSGNLYGGRIGLVAPDGMVTLINAAQKLDVVRLSRIEDNGLLRIGDALALKQRTGAVVTGTLEAYDADAKTLTVNDGTTRQTLAIADLVVPATRIVGPTVARAPADAAGLNRLVEALPPVNGVTTQRSSEVPYKLPPDLQSFGGTTGNQLTVKGLADGTRYLFVVDPAGVLRIAAERQSGLRRPLKHGDLVPANFDPITRTYTPVESGNARGEARIGGEFVVVTAPTGERVLQLNIDSSYTFARLDGRNFYRRSVLEATGRLFDAAGDGGFRVQLTGEALRR